MNLQLTDFIRWILTAALLVEVWRSVPWPVSLLLLLLTINAEVAAFSLRKLRLLLFKGVIESAVKQ